MRVSSTNDHASKMHLFAFVHDGESQMPSIATLVWEPYHLSTLLPHDNDDRLTNAFNALFEHEPLRTDMHDATMRMPYNSFDLNCPIYAVWDHLLRPLFDAFMPNVDRVPGGDDDSFDYYPSAVCFAYQIACDIREHLNDAGPVERLRSVLTNVRERWATAEHHTGEIDWYEMFDNEVIDPTKLT